MNSQTLQDIANIVGIISGVLAIIAAITATVVSSRWQQFRNWMTSNRIQVIRILFITNICLLVLTVFMLSLFLGAVHSLQEASRQQLPSGANATPVSTTPASATSSRLGAVKNVPISCSNYGDDPLSGNGCSKAFPLQMILNSIDVSHNPILWHFTLSILQGGTGGACENISFKQIQLTDETGQVYPAEGQKDNLSLSPGQSLSIVFMFDIHPKARQTYALNLRIQTCYAVTVFTTASFST